MNPSMHLIAMQRRQAAQAAQALSAHRRFVANARRNAAAQQIARSREEAARRRQEVINSLWDAVLKPLDCTPCDHSLGARSMLFAHNWVDSHGVDRVVFRCNTILPGSGRAAALLIWNSKNAEWVDLVTATLGDLVKQGCVFLYLANLTLPNGDAFVVLPAHFEGDDGVYGHWSFPTVGSYRGRVFCVGLGGYGTFVDPHYRDYLVARPCTYSDKDKTWIWSGRSSVREDNKLVILATSPFDRDVPPIRFMLSPVRADQPIAALRCAVRDDQGAPLAIVDMKEGKRHLLVSREGRLYLVCKPNRKTSNEIPLLVVPTRPAEDGAMVFSGSGVFCGRDIPFEIEANDKDGDGHPILVARANAMINKQPMVAIALRELTHDERQVNL